MDATGSSMAAPAVPAAGESVCCQALAPVSLEPEAAPPRVAGD